MYGRFYTASEPSKQVLDRLHAIIMVHPCGGRGSRLDSHDSPFCLRPFEALGAPCHAVQDNPAGATVLAMGAVVEGVNQGRARRFVGHI